MKFVPTRIPEVIIVEPDVFRDERGCFVETYHRQKYTASGLPHTFVQDNQSDSKRGVLRGLHGQVKRPQGKLVRASQGEVFDVAVDIRPRAASFGQWVGVTLSAENFRQLWIPPGFLHGFCVLSETAQVQYKCTTLYDRQDEIGLIWNDEEVGIEWPIQGPELSPKDAANPTLKELREQLLDLSHAD